jgi:DNA repair protein RadA/Sms
VRKRKETPAFFCTACGGESARWFGQCPHCGKWNTLAEAPSGAPLARRGGPARKREAGPVGAEGPRPLGTIDGAAAARTPVGISELDRALGGGIVPGSVILLGGDPGVGKSTLALQAAGALAASGRPCLYVTGEESPQQVQLRAARIQGSSPEMLIAAEGDVSRVAEWTIERRPILLIVDSVQTAFDPDVDGAPGSITQVRESALRLHAVAKSLGVAVLLIGHVTKEGAIAGPRVLEHMVDTVLYFEGEGIGNTRVLRAVKNRFGSTDEIGLFEMREAGLVEVKDPSRLLADTDAGRTDGSVVVPTIEGTRPILLEVQALVSPAAYGMAQRVASGIDPKRLAVLLAVLRKHAGVDVSAHDVFLNVVSGIRITEPAADLGVLIAVVSSLYDRALPERLALFGEVGLGGEVRGVGQAERRIAEAMRVGFERVIVPQAVARDLPKRHEETVTPVRRLDEALRAAALAPTPARSPRSMRGPSPGASGAERPAPERGEGIGPRGGHA